MTSRSQFSERECAARSRLTKLLYDQEVVAGSLVTTKQTCGKSDCRCRRGEKHLAVYVGVKFRGKRRMFSVSAERREQMRQAVDAYKQMRRLLEVVSEECCARMLGK